jgi:predicted ATPase
MITRWKVSNFKSIREPIDLALAPLTIFCGPNSSGKSALIKSILTISQSLGSQIWEEPLVLNGRFLNLGNFEDVLHYGNETTQMDIGFSIQTSTGETVTLNAAIEPEVVVPSRVAGRLRARLKHCALVSTTPSGSETISISRRNIFELVSVDEINRSPEILRSQLQCGLFSYELSEPKSSELSSERNIAEPRASSLSNILPGRLLYRVQPDLRELTQDVRLVAEAVRTLGDRYTQPLPKHERERQLHEGVKATFAYIKRRIVRFRPGEQQRGDSSRFLGEVAIEIIDDIIATERVLKVQDCLDSIQRVARARGVRSIQPVVGDLSRRLTGSLIELQEIVAESKLGKARSELEAQLYPVHYRNILERVRDRIGNQIVYLGPLRDDPRVIYAIPSQANQRDIGLKGEFTAAMLDSFGDRLVEYPVPPELHGNFPGAYEVRQGTLNEAAMVWLQRMGLADFLQASETSRVGYNLTVRPQGLSRDVDLTSVGVGLSQVLPTIVMALLAPIGTTLIFEQPEVHLHPKVQSILGDFFLGLTACNKQCLVETHSEHLLNRIRRRIAEATDTTLLHKVGVYFVTRSEGVSHYELIKLNEFGAIPQWPDGFFDEVEEESSLIMQAALAKRKQRNPTPRQGSKG